MIDWFVVPLALLPIVLLFAFLGCVLDREGGGTPVTFTYPAGLNVDVQRFEASFDTSSLESGDGESTFTVVPPVERVNEGTPPLLAAGEFGETKITAGLIGLDTHGSIICTCAIKLLPPDDLTQPMPNISAQKEKEEDEDPPEFRLERDGNGWFILT